MAEYFAWTVTGVITGLKTWSEPDYGSAEDASADGTGAIQIASRMVERQRFLIHQRDGREMEVTLADSGLVLRNGHVVTAVLVARKGLNHGFCVIVDNHTTGAQIRLADNIKRIRPKVGLFRTAKYGMLATLPALLAMALWLLVPGSLGRTDLDSIFLIMSIAIIVLFVIGLIVAKLVLDYLQADDDQKIWQVAEEASTEVRTSIRQNPKSRPRF
jgi:hypothetical protein